MIKALCHASASDRRYPTNARATVAYPKPCIIHSAPPDPAATPQVHSFSPDGTNAGRAPGLCAARFPWSLGVGLARFGQFFTETPALSRAKGDVHSLVIDDLWLLEYLPVKPGHSQHLLQLAKGDTCSPRAS